MTTIHKLSLPILFMCLHGCVQDGGSNDTLETIYINNGSIQCESSGLSEQETAQQLIDNGIDVIISTCGSLTSIDVPTVCGTSDIFINLHVINAQNLVDAKALGFETVSLLKNEHDIGYIVLGCEE